MSILRQLLKLLQDSVESLEAACQENDLPIPDLDTTFHPISEAFRMDPIAAEAARVASSAALHIAAILMPPHLTAYHVISGPWKAFALRGLNVGEIAAKNGQDPSKLSRLLRVLATNYIYREVKPDVFTNNRISSMLDSLMPLQEVLSNPEVKYRTAFGFGALVCHHLDETFKTCTYGWECLSDPQMRHSYDPRDSPGGALAGHHLDETFKACAYGWECLSDPQMAHSHDPRDSPFSKAIGERITLWDFYARPGESLRQKRFGLAMLGVQENAQVPGAILEAFSWASLAPGSLIVDVGGGVCGTTQELAIHFPQFDYVIQDLPKVVNEGKQHWEKEMPHALKSGFVQFQEHDFFEEQPQKNATIFLLKGIAPNWADPYFVKILSRLRKAAKPDTKLLLMDSIIPFACRTPPCDPSTAVPGSLQQYAPEPLLANYGPPNETVYHLDMVSNVGVVVQDVYLVQFAGAYIASHAVDFTKDWLGDDQGSPAARRK
ncbi:hypothetical protein ONZ45_g9012 [Pleurotus djamor]|nr:hypothetical protein ONZ45_g9012 [Pleurotus djamor]